MGEYGNVCSAVCCSFNCAVALSSIININRRGFNLSRSALIKRVPFVLMLYDCNLDLWPESLHTCGLHALFGSCSQAQIGQKTAEKHQIILLK